MNFLINLLYHLGTVGILFVGGWFVMRGRPRSAPSSPSFRGWPRSTTLGTTLVTFLRDMTNARVKYRLIADVLNKQDPAEAVTPSRCG